MSRCRENARRRLATLNGAFNWKGADIGAAACPRRYRFRSLAGPVVTMLSDICASSPGYHAPPAVIGLSIEKRLAGPFRADRSQSGCDKYDPQKSSRRKTEQESEPLQGPVGRTPRGRTPEGLGASDRRRQDFRLENCDPGPAASAGTGKRVSLKRVRVKSRTRRSSTRRSGAHCIAMGVVADERRARTVPGRENSAPSPP